MKKIDKLFKYFEYHQLKFSAFFVIVWSYFLYIYYTESQENFYQDWRFILTTLLLIWEFHTIYTTIKNRKKLKEIIDK